MKKFLNFIKNLFVWLVVILAVCMMIFTVISITTIDKNHRSLFGYLAFIVQSDSMSATDFAAGDIVLVKEVEDPSVLQVGDIIAYISQNESSYNETVTHKIRSLTTDEWGNPGFITYGTTTNVNDEMVVTYPYVLGKYVVSLPRVGFFFQFLKTPFGYVLCILVPFLLMICIQGIKSVHAFRRYRKEEADEIQAEKDRIALERREAMEMMREILELKGQLALLLPAGAGPGVSVHAENSPAEDDLVIVELDEEDLDGEEQENGGQVVYELHTIPVPEDDFDIVELENDDFDILDID